jgi:holin-like protein
MLGFFTLLLVCQLVGEAIVAATGIPVPGPVVGMAILFAGLLIRGGIPEGLAATADTLLSHLSLLFVPAGVGVMVHARLIGTEILPITVSLVVSTLLTIAVTALLMRWLNRWGERR